MATLCDEAGRPITTGVFWGRLKSRPWDHLKVERDDPGSSLFVRMLGECLLVSEFEWDVAWPLEGMGSPPNAWPRPDPFAPVKGGGFSSPESLHVGEVGTSRGGMTIWDEYVVAVAGHIVGFPGLLDGRENKSASSVARFAAMIADELLAERAKRGIGNDE